MTKPVAAYVLGMLLCAAAALAAAIVVAPVDGSAPISILISLAVLGIAAEVLSLLLPASTTISIAAIPFLAAALISPTWLAAGVITTAAAVSELLHRRSFVKSLFNVAQTALAVSIAILVYRALGASPLLAFAHASFVDATLASALPVLALIITSQIINTASVSGVIALNDHKGFMAVWQRNYLSTLGYDILSAPFIFLFAWATVKLGVVGAAVLGIPAMGFHQLYKTKIDLERAHQDLLQLMVKAIEARDPYTSGHSQRVQKYSMIIARALGLRDRDAERIGFAALLHDVGKIHEVYAPILRKPDKLTAEERAVMQTHAVKGAELVATVSSLKDLVVPVRHHHENWDGSGYPDGLCGEQIPLASRIIMFADTIDAMTSDRPYRKALTEVQVRSELIKYRGKQFDPTICDQLLRSPMFGMLFSGTSSGALPTRQRRTSPAHPIRAVVGS